MLDAGAEEAVVDFFGVPARHSGVRHQEIHVASVLLDESYGFHCFVDQIARAERMVDSAGELALDDELSAEVLIRCRLPATGERAISTTIIRVEKRFDRLPEDFASNA